MKQKLKRFMAGFMAMLTLVGTLFANGTTAFAASPQANIAFWYASTKNSGEVSELKAGYNHGKILYSILDGNSAYCMNFGLKADGGQLMNSYDDASTSMSAQQRKLLSYCLYYGFNSTQKAAPSNSQCDEYIATQAMVWVIVADIFGTGSGDSAARKLCNTAPSPDSSYSYYERLRDNISSSYNATLPSFASRRTSEAPTYELKWNEGSQRFETTLSDSNGVLSDFDFGISGYSVDKNGNSITISSTSVNTTATTGTFTSNAGKVETTSSCVFWLTGKSGYQEFISERPTADPIKAYIKVKTENIGYGELTKTDESSGVKLSGAVYGVYSDSGCTNRVQTMTTDGNGYAKSAALVAGTYYVKEITAPKGYVLSGKVHTLTVKAGQTTGISATDKEQLGAITIYKEGEVLSSWNGSNFTYEKKKLSGAAFKVTAGADIYKADSTKVYSAGDVVAESLTTGTDGQVVLSDLHLGTYVVTEIKSIDGYTINTTPQTVAVEYKDQTVTVQYESTTIENTRQKAEVSVVKKDSDTENPLDGGKYTLYAGNDIKNYAGQVIVTKGTALETVTTGENGKAIITVEYSDAPAVGELTVEKKGEVLDGFKGGLLASSYEKEFVYKEGSLAGAKFKVYAAEDIYTADNQKDADGNRIKYYSKGDLVTTLTTGKDGKATAKNLPLGQYRVVEVEAPYGYVLNPNEQKVTFTYVDDKTPVIKEKQIRFDKELSSPECLTKMKELAMTDKGWIDDFILHYEKNDRTFERGQTFHNFNDHDYMVLEALSPRNLVVMDMKSGSLTIALGATEYKRYPKDKKPTKDNTTIGVSWEHGIYLGSTLSTTNFKAYKREYGTPEKIEDIYDYRAKLKQKFYFYQDMSKDDDVPKKLQNDFLHQMYEDFGTIEEDCFYDRLEDGKYDEGFSQTAADWRI